jgi:diketogulonate reductase-like aldo/keto reductase
VKDTCDIVKMMREKHSAGRSPEHLRENMDCVKIKLDPDDAERLRREFPGRQTVSFAVPLK